MNARFKRYFSALVLALALVASITSCTPVETPEFGTYFCDAETTYERGNDVYFETETVLFGKGESQDDEHSYGGKFSSKVDSVQQYGMGLKIADVKGGSTILVKCWRYNVGGSGSIVVSSPDGETLHAATHRASAYGPAGWSLLKLKVRVPEEAEGMEIVVYTRSDLGKTSWFDDLEVVYGQGDLDFPLTYEGAPEFELIIPSESHAKLQGYRDSAFAAGVISDKQKKYVNAFLLVDGRKLPISMRLKGDWLDHISTAKWSFRIKIENGEAWRGMRSFNIQAPHTRNYVSEWLIHELCRQEDVLTTTYDFVHVSINGTSNGLYAFEEHFEKQLVESRKRREGPILKLDETGFWSSNLYNKTTEKWKHFPFYEASVVSVFKKKKTMKSPGLKQQFNIAQNLLYQYKNAKAGPDKMFDRKAWARYYALLDIGRIAHAQNWHNKRFYYNPVTCKLEPIVYDCYSKDRIASRQRKPIWIQIGDYPFDLPSVEKYCDFYLFEDSVFVSHYLNYLKQYSSDEFITAFYEKMKPEIEERKLWMYKDYPNIDYDDSMLYHHAADIRKGLASAFEAAENHEIKFGHDPEMGPFDLADEPLPGVSLTSYYEDSTAKGEMYKLFNYHMAPLYIVGYGNKKSRMDSFEVPIKLDRFKPEVYEKWNALYLPYRAKRLYFCTEPGGKLYTSKALPWPAPTEGSPEQAIFAKTVLDAPNSVVYTVDVQNKEIVLNAGVHTLTQDIIIPIGYNVVAQPGCKIDLQKGAAIISKSPVKFEGTADNPIVISSSDGTGQGLTVLQAEGLSHMRFVEFVGLNTLNRDGWVLTGAVNFYECELELYNCTFRNNHCEDALNIIRSSFTMLQCEFRETWGDALDIDFGVGTVSECEFHDAGNDALDFSGSEITISNCIVLNPGDKGISGGEHSTITIQDTKVVGAQIGVAAKDLSEATISNITLENCPIGFAVFRKKPEYGPANMTITGLTQSDVAKLMVVETASTLSLDGQLTDGKEDISSYGWYE